MQLGLRGRQQEMRATMAHASAVAKPASTIMAADPACIPRLTPSLHVDAAGSALRAADATAT